MVASAALVSVDEYLRTEYTPSCDYIDGVLRQKSMPTSDHSELQFILCALIRRTPGFTAHGELTCRIREGKYLVPDVVAQRLDDVQRPYPTSPVHMCAEILSPGDRFADSVAKCGEYHAWGVRWCWIIDPDRRELWQYEAGGRPARIERNGRIEAGPIILSHAEIFDSLPL